MSAVFRVACMQNCAADDMEANLAWAERQARAAHADGAALILFPEHFSCMRPGATALRDAALPEDRHPALPLFCSLARELQAWFLLGSLAIAAGDGRFWNRSILIDAHGRLVARYDKIHLFDVALRSGESYRESATVRPGQTAVTAATPWGVLGLSVCYDVRFPQLYRQLARAGAQFLAIPSAFTRSTGEAHWHLLVRARAVETGCFVFAPAQCGVRPWGRATYGHSLVVDPWGTVLAEAGVAPGYVLADVDPARVAEVRTMIPSLEHERGFE